MQFSLALTSKEDWALPYKTILVTGALITFSAVLGAWWGFKQGQQYGSALESVAFAHISTAQIKRLKSGGPEDIENVISLFDIYINHGVDRFYWYTKNGNKQVGEFFYKGYEKSLVKAMKGIASFRVVNPEKDISDHLSGEAKQAYVDGYITREAVIELMADK